MYIMKCSTYKVKETTLVTGSLVSNSPHYECQSQQSSCKIICLTSTGKVESKDTIKEISIFCVKGLVSVHVLPGIAFCQPLEAERDCTIAMVTKSLSVFPQNQNLIVLSKMDNLYSSYQSQLSLSYSLLIIPRQSMKSGL